MNTRTLIINSLLAALYVAVSLFLYNFSYGLMQFRVSEMLNLLVVYNRKYFFGIVVGVFLTNIFSQNGVLDLFFGVGQSVIALGITIIFGLIIKNKVQLMSISTIIFTLTMAIIAYEIILVNNVQNVPNDPFLIMWGLVAIGEFTVMAIGIPIIYALDKRLHFKELI